MGDWPITSHSRTQVGAMVPTDFVYGASISGGISTKSAWTQIVPATSFDATLIRIWFRVGASNREMLIDLGVGGAGSEQVLVPDIYVANLTQTLNEVVLPLNIPAGSRIAARVQAAATGGSAVLGVTLMQRGFGDVSPLTSVTSYGVDAGATRGTTVDPGSVSNTRGAWVQLTSATSRLHRGIFLSIGNRANNSMLDGALTFEVAVGASGAEQVIVPDYLVGMTAAEAISPSLTHCVPVDIPAGVRLAIRATSHVTDATDRLLAVVAHCLS